MIGMYFERVHALLKEVEERQAGEMERAAHMLAEATAGGRRIFAFGCSHAGLLAQELCYRTGGMATINAVRAPGMNLDASPITMTSQMERMAEYGRVIAASLPIAPGDVFILHSVSGRNAVIVDLALGARERGARIIALTNITYSRAVTPRHPEGIKLMDTADILLDNVGSVGDACLDVPGVVEKVAPTSTVIGAAMLNAIVARAIEIIAQSGAVPPVFVSANLDGGDEHNGRVLAAYGEQILYM